MTTMTAVAAPPRERPILFSGEMVRALLNGSKTQTRRVLKPQPPRRGDGPDHAPIGEVSLRPDMLPTGPTRGWLFCHQTAIGTRRYMGVDTFAREWCPYGAIGERLWVRESLREDDGVWCYAADRTAIELDEDNPRVPAMVSWAYHKDGDSCPSIHMPRWASRITLEITNIRVERVQDITDADAIAEGCFDEKEHDGSMPTGIYRQLWDALNAKRGYSWDSNPWVWCIEFRRITP